MVEWLNHLMDIRIGFSSINLGENKNLMLTESEAKQIEKQKYPFHVGFLKASPPEGLVSTHLLFGELRQNGPEEEEEEEEEGQIGK